MAFAKKYRWVMSAILLGMATAAHADENLLGYTAGAETVPENAQALYLWNTYRSGKSAGTYHAVDTRIEYERGLTHSLTASALIGLSSMKSRQAAPLTRDADKSFAFQSASGLFKYNLWSPFTEPVGLAVMVEPGFSSLNRVTGRSGRVYYIDTTFIAQKNFLGDTLITMANVSPRLAYKDGRHGDADKSVISTEISGGAAWRFTNNWYVGGEVRYETIFDDKGPYTALFSGPSLHWGERKGWATLTWMPQLYGHDVGSSNQQLLHHEKNEIRLKFGLNL